MVSTKKAVKGAKSPGSNGGTKEVPTEQGAGLWKLFPVLTVLAGIAVGVLWEPGAQEAAAGDAKAGSAKNDGDARRLWLCFCLCLLYFPVIE